MRRSSISIPFMTIAPHDITCVASFYYLALQSPSTIGGGKGDVTNLSPFWEGTTRKKYPTGDIFDQHPDKIS